MKVKPANQQKPLNTNQQPRPKGTGYVVLVRYLYSGFNTFFKRSEGRGIKPLNTNKNKKKHCHTWQRVFILLFCFFLLTCKAKEKPFEQIEESALVEPKEEKAAPEISPADLQQASTNQSVQVSYHVQRPSSLAGIGGRVNTYEINPVNYENPDLDVLKHMGVEQYLISYLAGEQFFKAGDYNKAITEYTSSINSNGEFIEAFISRGNTWFKRGEYSRAVDDYTRSIRLDDSRAELYNYRGFARAELAASSIAASQQAVNLRELNLAIEDFSRAIALNGNYTDALINRSHAYYQTGDYDKTIEDCNRILRLEPENAYIWNRRGSAYYHTKDDDRAIRDFTEAIRLRRNYAIAWYNRANAWYSKGDLQRANEDFAEAQRLTIE